MRTVKSFLLAAAALLTVATTGCIDPSASPQQRELLAAEAVRIPEHVAFVFDRSASIQEPQIAKAYELMRARIATLTHADRITAMELLQRSIEEVPTRWSEDVPRRERSDLMLASDSVAVDRFLRDATAYLRSFADPKGRDQIMGTDILSTLHDLSEEFRARDNTSKTLYLFSDMLQSTSTIEMEGGTVPSANWIASAADEGIIPDLTGVCVVVVGARVDTRAGQRVKAFWKNYFDAAGATLLDANYSYRPVRLPGAGACR